MASKWSRATLSTLVSSLEAGVSVNSNDRPPNTGELGVLKTSAISGGTFNPNESKTVLPAERSRVCTCVTAKGIIVSRMNTPELVGESALVDDDFPNLFLPDRLWLMMVQDERCQARWLSHFLRSSISRRFIAVSATGTSGSMKNLPKPRFLAMPVDVPPLPEQRTIAAVLDTIDDAIQKTEQIIAKLQQVKQGLLHDLLTRGIDDNGELRDPERHPEQFQDSPLGRIPKGWDVRALNDLVDRMRPIVYGILMPGYGFAGGVPVVKVKDIVDGRVLDGDLLLTSPRIDEEYRRSRLRAGDLLFTIRGTVGRMAFVPPHLAGANITQDTARLAVVGSSPSFVRHYLSMPVPRRFVKVHTLGVAVQGINLGEVRRIPIAVPSQEEADEVAARLDTLEQRVAEETRSAAGLRSIKAGLSEDLLTGRVRTTSLPECAA